MHNRYMHNRYNAMMPSSILAENIKPKWKKPSQCWKCKSSYIFQHNKGFICGNCGQRL